MIFQTPNRNSNNKKDLREPFTQLNTDIRNEI